MNTARPKILLIDDDPLQALMVRGFLDVDRHRPFALDCAATLSAGIQKLVSTPVDVVVLDLGLPDSDRDETFPRLHREFPTKPVVVLTSVEDEDLGLRLIQAGAQDYLVKGEINGTLFCRALAHAIERQQLLGTLQQALAEVKTLSGLLPICGSCKKIRDDTGYWNQLENYLHEHAGATFSHGMCPDCMRTYYPAFADEVKRATAGGGTG